MKTYINISSRKVNDALSAYKLDGHDDLSLDTSNKSTKIDLDNIPRVFVNYLLKQQLTKKQSLILQSSLGEFDPEQTVSSLDELFVALTPLCLTDQNNLTVTAQIGTKRIPIRFEVKFIRSFLGKRFLYGMTAVKIADRDQRIDWCFDEELFIENEKKISKTITSVLAGQGIKIATKDQINKYRSDVLKAEELSKQKKMLYDVVGPVLSVAKLFFSEKLQHSKFGSKHNPKNVIIEPELESESHKRDIWDDYHEDTLDLGSAFVRAFSLDLKSYVYVHVDDIVEHVFDQSAKDRIVLPSKKKMILDRIFERNNDMIFGDMFSNRHGGMIILASGEPGVGKTLTAEVYAEYTRRPLYVLEMGELGTNLNSVEHNLMTIFERATRWNAILLFDEAEIFLAKRGDNLDRNAIVGVFLRLLDHYDGTMFLTTNRYDVIDPAFKSRITLKIDYPKLDSVAREKIWLDLFSAAKINFQGNIAKIAIKDFNGRQIRNFVRLIHTFYCDQDFVTDNDILNLLEFSTDS